MEAQWQLRDSYGRVANDLRISLTDRCNLRCTYCLPEENTQWMAREDLATRAELRRLVGIAVRHLGITEIRFTGGEPLLRPDLEGIIADTTACLREAGLPVKVALTSNGIGLEQRVAGLVEAGLQRINISLDTLDKERFFTLTRRRRLAQTLRGIEAAKRAGLEPVKVNTVLLDHATLAEVPQLIRFCLRAGAIWRGIEYMPIGAPATQISAASPPNAEEILDFLSRDFELQPQAGPRSAPAKLWQVRERGGDLRGSIGLILAVSRPFCHDCNRTRLAADGKVRTCLFARTTTDLLGPLRAGCSDREIAQLWAQAQWDKPIGHEISSAGFVPLPTLMSAIGG